MYEDWTLLKRLIWMWRVVGGAAPILKTITGALLHITDALAKPAHELVAVLSPVQSGSGDPSPENVRPITGWTGLTIVHTGKNILYDPDFVSGYYIPSSGVPTAQTGYKYSRTYYPCEPGMVFTGQAVAPNNQQYGYNLAVYDKAKVFITRYSFVAASNWRQGKNVGTVTIPENAYYFRVNVAQNATKIQIEIGSTATEYEDASHTTSLPVSWEDTAGTVYGGSITVNEDGSVDLSGLWTKVRLGDLTLANFGSNDNGCAGRFTLTKSAKSGNSAFVCPALASAISTQASQYAGYDWNRIINQLSSSVNEAFALNENRLSVAITGAMTQADFLTTVEDWEIAYEMATAQSYHFDNIGQLILFEGENNIWVDASDDLTLTYYADGNVSDLEALNTLLGGAYTPGDTSDRDALNILLGN